MFYAVKIELNLVIPAGASRLSSSFQSALGASVTQKVEENTTIGSSELSALWSLFFCQNRVKHGGAEYGRRD